MRSFLSVTVGPGAADRLRRPIEAALASLTDGANTPVERLDVTGNGWVAFAGTDDQDALGPPGGAFTVPLGRLMRTREAELGAADLPAVLSDGGKLATLLPPFAAAHRAEPDGPVIVATDWLGFRQLYWWRGDGAAAVSTSARALSVIAGGGFDAEGLGAQAMIGWQVGDRTPFEGVRAFPAATIAELVDGTLALRQYAPALEQTGPAPSLDDAVDEMAAILTSWQSRYLADHPDAVLQLTGGHDSRILLGAIPPEQRRGLRALTLGEETHPDVVIAARLADRYGMRHEVHRLDEFPQTPAAAHELALTAAGALEYQASPMALAPLLLVEAHLDQGHRLSGLGGEVARGFYYARQPKNARTTPRLVERLAKWRICANEAVEPAALDATFLAEARERTLSTLNSLFEPGNWLRATDASLPLPSNAPMGRRAWDRCRSTSPYGEPDVRSPLHRARPRRCTRGQEGLDVARSAHDEARSGAGSHTDRLRPCPVAPRYSRSGHAGCDRERHGPEGPEQGPSAAHPWPASSARRGRHRESGSRTLAGLPVVVSGVVRPADAEPPMGRRHGAAEPRRSPHDHCIHGEPPRCGVVATC